MAVGRFGWKHVATLVGVVVAVQVGIVAGVKWFIPDAAAQGQFGDTFGATNSLFSGLALAGLICTLILQQRQMKVQGIDSERIRVEAASALMIQQRSNHLNALTFLMRHYDDRLARLTSDRSSGPAAADVLRERDALSAQRLQLERIVAGLHETVVSGLGDQHVR